MYRRRERNKYLKQYIKRYMLIMIFVFFISKKTLKLSFVLFFMFACLTSSESGPVCKATGGTPGSRSQLRNVDFTFH